MLLCSLPDRGRSRDPDMRASDSLPNWDRLGPNEGGRKNNVSKPQLFVGLDLGKVKDYTALVANEKRMIDFVGDSSPAAPPDAVAVHPPGTPLNIHHGKGAGLQAPPAERLKSQYIARYVQRFELETNYLDIVPRVASFFLLDKFRAERYPDPWLVIDQTGVGAPVVEQFKRARYEPVRCPKCGGCGAITTAEPCLACGGIGKVLLKARVAAVHIVGQLGQAGGDGFRYDKDRDTWYVAKRDLVGVLIVLMESNPGRFVIDPRLKNAKVLSTELGMFRAKQRADSTKDASLEAWRERDHDDLVLAAALSLWFAEKAAKKPWIHL
jgi:hypothetical protein